MCSPPLPSGTFGASQRFDSGLVHGAAQRKALLLYVSCGIGKINLYKLHLWSQSSSVAAC
jgi:hypothetical protein